MARARSGNAALSVIVGRIAAAALLVLAVIALVGRAWIGSGVLVALAAVAAWWAGRRAGGKHVAARRVPEAAEPSVGPLADRQALVEKLRRLSEPELRDYAARLFRKLGHRVARGAEEEELGAGEVVLEQGEQRILLRCLRLGPGAVEAAREFAQAVVRGGYSGGYAVVAEEVPPEVFGALGGAGVTLVGPERLAFLAQTVADQPGPPA